MEAHIKLTLTDVILTKKVADLAGAAYVPCLSPYIRTKNGRMSGGYKDWSTTFDEVTFNEETREYKDKNDNIVHEWNIFDSVVKNEIGIYVILQEDQFVDMKLWCKYVHIPFKVVSIEESKEEAANTELEANRAVADIKELQDKISKQVEDWIEKFEPMYNHQCSVNVGSLVTQFNEVELVEDSCTDALQDMLNDGWRIISACVQPDSRRPDYILGRWNPTFRI